MTANEQFVFVLTGLVVAIIWLFATWLTFLDWDEEVQETQTTDDKNKPTANLDRKNGLLGSYDDKENAERSSNKKANTLFHIRQINTARGLNVFTGLATIAGLFGLFVLYGTLTQTKVATETARAEFEASERPWVSISRTEASGKISADNRISARFEITNSGKSPASHVWFIRNELTVSNGKILNAWFDCKGKPIDSGVGILLVPNAPHEVMPIFSEPLDSDTVEYIREGLGQVPKPAKLPNRHPQQITFIGCINYVWADRCHNTRFCEEYQPTASPSHPNGYFSYCNFNNDTDEDEHCQIHK
jgi:hypothetical protein